MGMSSGEMVTTASSTTLKQKCMDVGVGGRQRKRWINTISQDLITLNLTSVDAEEDRVD